MHLWRIWGQACIDQCAPAAVFNKAMRLPSLPSLCPRFSSTAEEELLGHSGGGSGGYLEHIYRYAAKDLFGIEVAEVQYKPLK